MNKYEITERSARFLSGKLELTEAQAKPRAHSLKRVKGEAGIYEIIEPVEFKVGEIIGFDGEPAKSLIAVVIPLTKDQEAALLKKRAAEAKRLAEEAAQRLADEAEAKRLADEADEQAKLDAEDLAAGRALRLAKK